MSPNNGQVRAVRVASILIFAACGAEPPSREQRIVETLADDNYVAANRDPALLALKFRKMQRGPYEWLRGTASLYWRDLMEPGAERAETTFGDPPSSRILLIGDPHPENVGTFRGFTDGQMFVDWNDFDATGYGPFTGDVRRLIAGFEVISELGAPGDVDYATQLATQIGQAYAEQIAAIAGGARVPAIGIGDNPLFDDELDKAQTRGDMLFAIDELAPATGDVRVLALGDLEDVGEDGVIEDRVLEVDAEEARMLDRAIASWAPGRLPAEAAIKLRARRVGSGISSYANFRYQVVLEGATTALEDDRIVELKETREGVIVRGLPMLQSGEWATPATRAVDTQIRLHARFDGDALLGAAQLGGLSLKIRDREAYQRGIDYDDLADLAGNPDDRDILLGIARTYGAMLARAHAQALTADRGLGVDVIAPLLAGREAAFAAEMAALGAADGAQVIADHALMKDRDLAAALRLPTGVSP